MVTFELSKTLKALIVTSALLIVPLAQVTLAKEGRGKGDGGRNDSQQQADKSPAQNKAPSPSRPAEVARRETPGRASQSDISKPQIRINKPSLSPQVVSPGRQLNVTKPSREQGQERRDFRISRAPSGVEVRRPASENTSGQQRVIKPDASATSKPKPDIGSRITAPVARPQDSRIETKPIIREKPEMSRTERVATRIESPRSESKPTREGERDTGRTINEGRITPIVLPREKPVPSQQSQTGGRNERENMRITDRAVESRRSEQPQHFGGNRPDNDSRPSRNVADNRVDFTRSHRRTVEIGSGDHDFRRFRPATTTRVAYEDRIGVFGRNHHNDFIFRDQHNRLVSHIIWPGYCYPVYYRWGQHFGFNRVYPFYHRRYAFVSLGGFWPDYTCVRYYWYPTHYYMWYGYAPVAYEIPGDTYNYYTYNYYTGQPAATTVYSTEATGLTPVDESTFADVREKLSREQKGPDAQTAADTLFDEGVKAFEQGGYVEAADKFAGAMTLAPDDEILPFAYAQALFAQGFYSQAADVLRTALQKVTPEKEGVYYPRGLYLDENTLDEQIDRLAKEAESRPNDSDLQLLLGYHWLGIGETEKSLSPLAKAKEDYKDFGAASTLLDLAEKIKAGETQ